MLEVSEWEKALDEWLEPFLAALGHKARCRWAPLYLRGLFGRTERKSVQPRAAEVTPDDHDQLHNFVASPAWDTAPLEEILAAKADALVGGDDAVLIIDDTALPKKGKHSVGVASPYAGVLGTTANCQGLVSLTLARREVPVPVVLRLFLPETGTGNPERCRWAGVPEPRTTARSKPEMALKELARLRGLGGALWRSRRRRRLWCQRGLPPWVERARPLLGSWGCLHPERRHDRGGGHVAASRNGAPTPARGGE